MDTAYAEQLEIALKAVQVASAVCSLVQREEAAKQVSKEDRSPVTVADLASQAVVARILQQHTPHIPLVAEETAAVFDQEGGGWLLDAVCRFVEQVTGEGDQRLVRDWVDYGHPAVDGADSFWTLDPIDGTKGFLRGDQYAVALALLRRGRVVLGVLACPNLASEGVTVSPPGEGVLLAATVASQTFVAPITDPARRRAVLVSSRTVPEGVRLCESVEAGHTAHGLAQRVAEALGCTAESLRIDSQAKYALVARGDAELYLRLPTRPDYREKIWDHAAGAIILEQAGGRVTDITGNPLDFGCGIKLERNRGIVASNGIIHEQVIEALRNVMEGP